MPVATAAAPWGRKRGGERPPRPPPGRSDPQGRERWQGTPQAARSPRRDRRARRASGSRRVAAATVPARRVAAGGPLGARGHAAHRMNSSDEGWAGCGGWHRRANPPTIGTPRPGQGCPTSHSAGRGTMPQRAGAGNRQLPMQGSCQPEGALHDPATPEGRIRPFPQGIHRLSPDLSTGYPADLAGLSRFLGITLAGLKQQQQPFRYSSGRLGRHDEYEAGGPRQSIDYRRVCISLTAAGARST